MKNPPRAPLPRKGANTGANPPPPKYPTLGTTFLNPPTGHNFFAKYPKLGTTFFSKGPFTKGVPAGGGGGSGNGH